MMIKSILVATMLAGAMPAWAVAGGGGGTVIPNPFYSNGFDTTAYKSVAGSSVTTHSAMAHYAGPVTVADPFFDLSVGAAPTPFLLARAHGGNGVIGVNADGGGTIEYNFVVTGPATMAVPLRAAVLIDAVVGGGTGSVESDAASVEIYTDLQNVGRVASVGIGSGASLPSHIHVSDVMAFSATANDHQLNTVQVTGSAIIAEAIGTSGYAHLFADPVITIDPTWAASHPGFALTFSPGIGNVPGASVMPEPAAWLLLMGGFGLIGAAMRARRANIVTAVRS